MTAHASRPRPPLARRALAALGVLALSAAACGEATRPVAPPALDVAGSVAAAQELPALLVLGAPVFDVDGAPDGGLLVAVNSAGLLRVRGGGTTTMASLRGISGVAAVGGGNAYVTTGGSPDPALLLPTSRKLFRVSNGGVREIADLWAYEQAVNPDQAWNVGPGSVDSNPFDVATLGGGRVLVADAAANDLLVVDANGDVDWVAVLTPVTPGGPQPVPTSVAVGPDGAYYVGELTGFPGTPGLSRVWRIEAGSRHVLCPSAACTVVASGFTSVIDLEFGPDGTLYVVELDEAGWFAMEQNGFMRTPAGGTVNACTVATGACTVRAGGLSLPTAVAVDADGALWVVEHAPILFATSRLRRLP